MPYFARLLPFFLLVWVLTQPVALLANGPQPLPEKEVTQLAAFLKQHWRTPEQYIIEKFKDRDIILLAEDHRIKHNLHLAHNLIPLLYQAGVYNFGMEFGASEDQAALDKLVTAEKYDEAQARRLMFHYNVGWAFKEYLDVYRAAWELNRTLPAGARKFRILNLSYRYDWSEATFVRTPENTKKVFHKGGTEWYRADLIKREILEKKEKILVLTGTPHAFTRYQMPVFDYNARQFYSFENRLLGNLLYKQAPKKVFTILLHQIFESKLNGAMESVYPARGAIDQVMATFSDKRVGFDLNGTPFGDLADTSFYSTGYDRFHLSQLADGYIYEKPFSEYEACTLDEHFVTEQDLPEIQRQSPDPYWRPRPKNLAEYWQQIRDYADIPRRYGNVKE